MISRDSALEESLAARPCFPANSTQLKLPYELTLFVWPCFVYLERGRMFYWLLEMSHLGGLVKRWCSVVQPSQYIFLVRLDPCKQLVWVKTTYIPEMWCPDFFAASLWAWCLLNSLCNFINKIMMEYIKIQNASSWYYATENHKASGQNWLSNELASSNRKAFRFFKWKRVHIWAEKWCLAMNASSAL